MGALRLCGGFSGAGLKGLGALLVSALLLACGGGDKPTGPPLGGLTKAVATLPQTGIWWNPAESGRGFTLETQGEQVALTVYGYEAGGNALWATGILALQSDGTFRGDLFRLSGGQTLGGAYRAPTGSSTLATALLTLTSSTAGSLRVQLAADGSSSTVPIERFAFASPAGSPPATGFQNGIWWNASESGRGFFIESQGRQVVISSYMYDAAGRPQWYSTVATLRGDGVTAVGPMLQFTGGQALGGAYKAPVSGGSAGTLTFVATSTTTALLMLPGRVPVPLRRFAFNLPAAPASVSYAPLGTEVSFDAGTRCAGPQWTTADVDGDGKLDFYLGISSSTVFTSTASSTDLTVWLTQADGTAADRTSTVFSGAASGALAFTRLAAGDYNGDGRSDVLIGDGGIDTYENGVPVGPWLGAPPRLALSQGSNLVNASASLAGLPPTFIHSVAQADIDGDGHLDLYIGSISVGDNKRPYLLLGDGKGGFTLDRSRLPDRVAVDWSVPFISQPDGTLVSKGQTYTGSIFFDANNDGYPDLALLAADGTTSSILLINDGTGHFERLPAIELPPGLFGAGGMTQYPLTGGGYRTTQGPGTISLGAVAIDVNNDGYLDLVIAQTFNNAGANIYYRGGRLQILINQQGKGFVDETAARGAPGFTSTSNYDAYSNNLTAFDLNGDGHLDLIAVHPLGGRHESHVFLNDGKGNFRRETPSGLPTAGALVGLSSRQGEPIRVAYINVASNGTVSTPGGTARACLWKSRTYQASVSTR